MSINLVTYANQTVTPTNDAIIYERAIDQNGIFYGCNVTVTSNTVNITGGYGIVCGREFVINSDSLTVTLAPSGTLQGRLYVRLDLADADAPIQLLTATGNTLPALTQDADVNYTNGVYEMELATFTVGVSALSDVVETFSIIHGNDSSHVLLWSNPAGISSRTSTMGDSNVTLTQSTEGVKYFIVEFRCFYNVGEKVTCLYFPGTTGIGARVECSRESGNPITMYSRTYYSVDQTTFHFSDCTRYASNAAAVVGQDTGCLVPIRIFMVV